jgi:peroxiredoxin
MSLVNLSNSVIAGLVMPFLLIITLQGAVPNVVQAGEYNQVLSLGDVMPAWEPLPGVDGKQYSSDSFAQADVVVVVFTCRSCPTAIDYEDRISRLQADTIAAGQKVQIVAICVNRVAEDKLSELTRHAAEKKLAFTYLYDESQATARTFGAIFTPEFYVFGKSRKLVYTGAFDDNTDAALAKDHFVANAVTAALTESKPAIGETIARGCRVRYARERK